MESYSDYGSKPVFASFLPLKLQDLCIIHLINDLESYPVDCLASLPRHLRSRLLHNLPVYDVCLLDHTSVSEGIDIDAILGSNHLSLHNKSVAIPVMGMYTADFFMSGVRYPKMTSISEADLDLVLDPALQAVYSNDPQNNTVKQAILLQVMWKIISNLQINPDLSLIAAEDLLSVKGHLFLLDSIQLPTNTPNPPSMGDPFNPMHQYQYQLAMYEDYYQLWKHSACGLSVFRSASFGNNTQRHTQLVPRHLLPIYQKANPMELLNLIVLKCGLKPKNMSMNVGILHKGYSALKAKNLVEGGISNQEFFRPLLSNINVLALKSVSLEYGDALKDVMEAVVGNGEHCSLRSLEIMREPPTAPLGTNLMEPVATPLGLHLGFLSPYLLTLPSDGPCSPHYQQLSVLELGFAVDESSTTYLNALLEQQITLKHVRLGLLDSCTKHSSCEEEEKLYSLILKLFERENFQTLRIHFHCRQTYRSISSVNFPLTDGHHSYRLIPLVKLLHSFLKVQCVNHLFLCIELMPGHLPQTEERPPASMDTSDVVPDCGLTHKTLYYDAKDSHFIVSHLLQFPVIRLRELELTLTRQKQPVFSRLAEHPNLKVSKVVLDVYFEHGDQRHHNDVLLSTLVQTLGIFFQMPSLKEISLYLDWIHYDDIKAALVAGLQQQLQICSLRKLSLLEAKLIANSGIDSSRSGSEFSELWEAIFSYPLLDQLEVVLGNSLSLAAVKLSQTIVKCWENFASKKNTKSSSIELHSTTFCRSRTTEKSCTRY